MAVVDNTLDDRGVVIDVGPVLSIDEEGSFETSGSQLVQSIVGVGKWAIIESKGNDTRLGAAVDDGADRNAALALGQWRGSSHGGQSADNERSDEHDGQGVV